MSKNSVETMIEILGKTYQIKCPESEMTALKSAAEFLETKMCYTRDIGKVIGLDRIAVITALNIAHQFLSLKNQNDDYIHIIQQRLRDLQINIDNALAQHAQMELSPAEQS